MAIRKKPIENIVATPLETNILEWHYVITGTKGTPYDGGFITANSCSRKSTH